MGKLNNGQYNAVSPNLYEFVTSKDINYAAGEDETWNWQKFNKVFLEEKAIGNGKYTQSALIACSLLAPYLQKKGHDLYGGRVRSDDDRDLYQEAFITICEKLPEYNPELGNFGTYISKYIVGLARDIQYAGMSNNDVKKGFRVYNFEAMATKDKDGEESQAYDIVDPKSAIEDICEERDRKRRDAIYTARVANPNEDNEEALFKAETIYTKFLGGFGNWEEIMQENIEEDLGERQIV